MTPQYPDFNRGIWMHLESQVRTWANVFGRVYVVSGPILNKTASDYPTIGQNKVAIPDFFYKVILVPLYENEEDANSPNDSKSVMALGFIIPNKKCDGTYWDYVVSIDEVEAKTGLDFFYLLDDNIENSIESTVLINKWK